MEEDYKQLVKLFSELDIKDKEKEIIKNMHELLNLLFVVNKKINHMNEMFPILSSYENEDEYLELIYTYIISIKEENAKLISEIQ